MADIDLTYLNEISGGDKEFIDEMINTFLEETPKDLEEMKTLAQTTNWAEVSKIAHKLKSSIKLFGMNSLRDKVLDIEQSGKTNTNLESLPQKTADFIDSCNATMEELKQHL